MKKINNIIKNKKIFEFIRFVIVGGIATVIHYTIYYILQAIEFKINIAYTIGYALSFIFNFIASNYFTFKTNISVKGGSKFAFAHVINYFIQIALLNIYIKVGIPSSIAPIFVFCIAIPINFIMVRIALRGTKKQEGDNEK